MMIMLINLKADSPASNLLRQGWADWLGSSSFQRLFQSPGGSTAAEL